MCRVPFAVAVNSGTDALILALRALGVGPGHEVITPPNSFVASSSCIAALGARPVFVDVRSDYNLDPGQIEAAITSRTRAILPVHLTGRPADMDPIRAIAARHGIKIVEDCAQAVTAEYNGAPVGSMGDFGCFSLHPLKTLSACGDGGIITTSHADLAERLRELRNLGLRTRDDCVTWCGNSRLDTIQAAILLVKLQYLEPWTALRRRGAAMYRRLLARVEQVQTPDERSYEKAVYHTFVIQAEQRDELKRFLLEHGIETAVHYPVPIHLQSVARELGYGPGSFPITERLAERILSLPIYPELTTDQFQFVSEKIRQFYGA
jgi:dTDP-4-amino-4,6-dideoxygalactose transaminase